MKPKALVYSSVEVIESLLKNYLEGLGIDTVHVDSVSATDVNYFFAVILQKEDLETIKPFLNLDAKIVIALPYDFSLSTNKVKSIHFFELLTPEVNHKLGYANWLLASLKTSESIYLPKEDLAIYPTVLSELFRFMTREAFTYYKTGEVFIYHPTSLHKFAEWLASSERNLMVNIDPSLNFAELKIDLEKYPTHYLPLSGEALRSLYAASTIVQDTPIRKVIKPKKAKKRVKIEVRLPKFSLPRFKNSYNLARLATLTILVIGMPVYLFLSSFGFLYLGTKTIERNAGLAKTFFEISGVIAETNSQVLGIASINNDLVESTRVLASSARIGRQAAIQDYESLYKELAFSEVSEAGESGMFSRLVNLIDVIPESRQKILAISRVEAVKEELAGQEEELDYLVVTFRDNFAQEAKVFTVEKSVKVGEETITPEKIDQNIKGVVDVPENILDILETESFQFKYINIGENFTENAEMAAWFVNKAYERDIDVVVFVFEHDLVIPEKVDGLNLETLFYGFKEGSIKSWSSDPTINSVLLDLNKLDSV